MTGLTRALMILLALPAVTAAQTPAPAQQGAAQPAATPAPAEMAIYGTALAPGWENWSWAQTVLSYELSGSARRPIRVAAGPYQGLYLHHAPFSTAPYRALSLLIHGNGQGQQIKVVAVVNGQPVADRARAATLSSNGWLRMDVALEQIGAANVMLDGIWVQNATNAELPPFYVAEVRLH